MKRKFKINDIIVLGFIEDNTQIDVMFRSDDNVHLELENNTIYLFNADTNKSYTSITTENAISMWLDSNKIKEI